MTAHTAELIGRLLDDVAKGKARGGLAVLHWTLLYPLK